MDRRTRGVVEVQQAWLLPSDYVEKTPQIELSLWGSEPWNGRSPRGLTRGARGIILTTRVGWRELPDADCEQFELFGRLGE